MSETQMSNAEDELPDHEYFTQNRNVYSVFQMRDERHAIAEDLVYGEMLEGSLTWGLGPYGFQKLSDNPTVAEAALSLLKAADLVAEIDVDERTFTLCEFVPLRPVKSLLEMAYAVSAHDIFEVASIFDVACAGLAAERASVADVADLRKFMEEDNDDEVNATSYLWQFNFRVCELAYNQIVRDFSHSVHTAKSVDIWSIFNAALFDPATGIPGQIREDRAAIVDAIESRDPEAARSAMQKHLERVRGFLFVQSLAP